MSEKINEGQLCEGPSDPRSKKCGVWGLHEWGHEIEGGLGKDNRAYPVCKKCGLICRMSIPAECLGHHKEQPLKTKKKFVTPDDFESPREKKCPCNQ